MALITHMLGIFLPAVVEEGAAKDTCKVSMTELGGPFADTLSTFSLLARCNWLFKQVTTCNIKCI